MSVLLAEATMAVALVALAAIAHERMRAYGLGSGILHPRGTLIAVALTVTRGLLAWHGIEGIDTSLAFAVGTVASITDLQCGYVFDRVLLAGGATLTAVAVVQGNIAAAAAGAAIATSLVGIPYALSRARGVGLGDVKLAGVLGIALGPYGALRTIWFAFVIGALVAIGGLATRRFSRQQALPFAPFLAFGAVLSVAGAA